jgi:glyoxylase-like metal-dependent hydrolase (beta-lactamase superfamily II)
MAALCGCTYSRSCQHAKASLH